MKIWKILVLSITMVANSSYACPLVVDKISAIVNNGIVLRSDIDNLMQSVKFNARQIDQQLPANDVLRHQILESLIMDQIILQIAQKMKIKISNEQLDRVIANIANQRNVTINQMQRQLSYDGINYSTYRNQICKEMLITEVRNSEVRSRVSILPKEVEILIKQNTNKHSANTKINISHIFIPLSEKSTPNQITKAKSQADIIVEQAHNGVDFAKLAMNITINKQAPKNIQMGWSSIRELPSIFVQELSEAKKGDIIGPIRSNAGFHVLKVNDLYDQNQNICVTEVHIRHILLKPSPIMTNEQIHARITQISTDIKNGKISFANAAKKFSQDLNSAHLGGDLGWAEANIYDHSIRNKLVKMKKGQMSMPVRSSLGWHLIELLDIRSIDKTNAIRKNLAYQMLFNHKFYEQAIIWMQEQRARAYVRYLSN